MTKPKPQRMLFLEVGLNVTPQQNLRYTDQTEFGNHTHLLGYWATNTTAFSHGYLSLT